MKRLFRDVSLAFLVGVLIYILCVTWKSNRELRVAQVVMAKGEALETFWNNMESDGLASILGPQIMGIAPAMARQIRCDSWNEALIHLKRALDWNIYNTRAERLIWRVAGLSREDGNAEFALRVYREYRSSLYGARSFFQPKKEAIKALDAEILNIISGTDAQKSQWALEHSRTSLPSTPWGALVTVAFFIWLLSVGLLIKNGFDPTGAIRAKTGDVQGGKLSRVNFMTYGLISLMLWNLWVFLLSRVG